MKEFWQKLATEVVEGFWVYSGISFASGQRQARRDLRAGKCTLKTFGKPAKWRDIYAEMLREPHGIILEPISEEMVGVKAREEIRGYNSLVKKAIIRKHGKDFLDAVVDRAKDRFLREEEVRRRDFPK